MGFLDRLFGKKDAAPAVVEKPVEVVCPHSSLLAPHWDDPQDFGKHELISSYVCDACGQSFSREEGERVMASVGEAVRGVVEIDDSLRKTTEEMLEGEKEN